MYQRKLNIFIFSIFLINVIIGQTDTLNKYNSKRKKNGYWKVFLNENANVIKDSSKACFYGFELWDNGEEVYFFAKHSKITSYEGITPIKGHPVPISGTFIWFDRKGRPSLEDRYENGHPVRFRSYHSQKSTESAKYVFEDIDFTKKYNNIPGTAFYEIHSFYDNSIKRYWFKKGPKGWRGYPTE